MKPALGVVALILSIALLFSAAAFLGDRSREVWRDSRDLPCESWGSHIEIRDVCVKGICSHPKTRVHYCLKRPPIKDASVYQETR